MLLKKIAFLLACICTHVVATAQSASVVRKPLVLATYTYSTNNRLNNLQPLADYLQAETGQTITAASFASVQELMDAIRQGQVDFAMINTLGYLSFQKKYGGVAIPLVSLDPGNLQTTNYGGCVLATRQSGIGSIADMKKTDSIIKLALVNKASTSGNLVPRLLFNSNGITNADKQFNVYYSGTHKQVVEDLLAGKTSIGGCGCSEYDKYLQVDKNFADRVVKIAEFNNIPLGPIIYRNGLSASLVQQVQKALLAVHEKKPAVFTNFRAGWTEFLSATRFRPAKDADYDEFRSLFGNNELLWKLLDE